MQSQALATLGVRFAGLVSVLVSLPTLGRYAGETITAFSLGYGWDYLSPTVGYGDTDTMNSIGWLALFAIGVYLLCFGRWVIGRVTRGIGVGCGVCGYDLRGVKGDVCPECGSTNATSTSEP
ncbi:MAG: hypothetical protein AAF138_06065 [Planctomycetota bacterium]